MRELESGFRISELISLLKRRSAIVLAASILGLVAGYLVFASAPPKYSATARVKVEILASDPNARPGSSSVADPLETESDLVKSDAIGDVVRKDLELAGDNRSLFRSLTVTTKENSLVLALTYESGSAAKARDTANAIARAYLDERSRAADESRNKKLTSVERDVERSKEELDAANAEIEATKAGTAARNQAQAAAQRAQQDYNDLLDDQAAFEDLNTTSGQLVRQAPLPKVVLSKKALGLGVGVFGLLVLAGLGVALLVDRRDSLGGGRRRVEQLVPGATIRVLPQAVKRKASPTEVDAAIDRLAVELIGGDSHDRATSVLIVGTQADPPVAMAQELASSLTFAGIPGLFVLAGDSRRELRQAHVIQSFTDLLTGPSITGPVSLPEVAGSGVGVSAPTVTWLRPQGSAEASGLLRRAVVEALISRAGREGFEAVVFVAATPTRNAAAAALGQWVTKTAVIVEGDGSQPVEQAVMALRESDIDIDEVVWT